MDYLLAMKLLVRSVELGSFSKAATFYGLKASSVSRYISGLEKDVGTLLFRRTTRHMVLTDAGSAFHDRAIKILLDVDEARRSASTSSAEPVGTLKLFAPVEFGSLHITPLLPHFMALTPGLSIDLTLGDADLDLAPPQYDLTITIGEPVDSRMYAQRFGRNRYVVCGAPSYLERGPAPKFPSALQNHNCLVHGLHDTWRFGSAKSTVEVAVTVAGNFHANRLSAVLAATLAGQGFARLPLWLAGQHVTSGALVTILQNYETMPEESIYGFYPEKRNLSPKVRSFLEFFAQRIGAPPAWEI